MARMDNTTPTATITAGASDRIKGELYLLSRSARPTLEVKLDMEPVRYVPFIRLGPGRTPDESRWLAEPYLPLGEAWQFRVSLSRHRYFGPLAGDFYQVRSRKLWLQDEQLFNYQPAPQVSPSRIVKIPKFSGSLSARALYVYLPRGYADHKDRYYPSLYMHDGQNCFEAFVGDSFAGSWQADQTADWLISQGRMRECLIVGVSNGQAARMAEYLPPYVLYQPPAPSAIRAAKRRGQRSASKPAQGRAGRTAAYYRYEVAPYILQHYRALTGREQTATCGSSMGGIFSTYLAWERTDFAKHHAALSPAYWITRTPKGTLEMVERLRSGQRRDIRLWLDSGTRDTADEGDDGMEDTLAARAALLENGYIEGRDFQHYLDRGATHSETAWAGRLPLVFEFLFPLEEGA